MFVFLAQRHIPFSSSRYLNVNQHQGPLNLKLIHRIKQASPSAPLSDVQFNATFPQPRTLTKRLTPNPDPERLMRGIYCRPDIAGQGR